MNKQAQSLIDFINFFPLQALHVRRSPISNKEAKTLYEMFKSDRDEYGKSIVPEEIDNLQVAALSTKGLLRSSFSGNQRVVEFTDKGRDIIRNIILYSEQSSFDKTDGNLNYESIFHKANETPKPDDGKIASKIKQESGSSWLKKARLWK